VCLFLFVIQTGVDASKAFHRFCVASGFKARIISDISRIDILCVFYCFYAAYCFPRAVWSEKTMKGLLYCLLDKSEGKGRHVG
jgi:hypothetical protein